jgi:hypothetical protein
MAHELVDIALGAGAKLLMNERGAYATTCLQSAYGALLSLMHQYIYLQKQ